jgi:hypothetical protein
MRALMTTAKRTLCSEPEFPGTLNNFLTTTIKRLKNFSSLYGIVFDCGTIWSDKRQIAGTWNL